MRCSKGAQGGIFSKLDATPTGNQKYLPRDLVPERARCVMRGIRSRVWEGRSNNRERGGGGVTLEDPPKGSKGSRGETENGGGGRRPEQKASKNLCR